MSKKFKVTKGMNYDQAAKLNKCISCNGSGYYDSWDYDNNCAIACESCDGTSTTVREFVNDVNIY